MEIVREYDDIMLEKEFDRCDAQDQEMAIANGIIEDLLEYHEIYDTLNSICLTAADDRIYITTETTKKLLVAILKEHL